MRTWVPDLPPPDAKYADPPWHPRDPIGYHRADVQQTTPGNEPMTRPWRTIDGVDTAEGRLELRQRGDDAFIITIAGRVLMNGTAHASEVALGQLACAAIAGRPAPRILIGGLGMGFTLRATLDAAPAKAQITVAELNPTVLRWCRGPMKGLTAGAVDDPRVKVQLEDVAKVIGRSRKQFDAIVLDLYEGPHAATQGAHDPLFGIEALGRIRQALAPGGVLAIWGEQRDHPFEQRLERSGFQMKIERPGGGGRRHVVYLGQ